MRQRQNRLTFGELAIVFASCFGLLIFTLLVADRFAGAINEEQETARQDAGVQGIQK